MFVVVVVAVVVVFLLLLLFLLVVVVAVLLVLSLSWFAAISKSYHRLDFLCRQPVFTIVLASLFLKSIL